MLTKKFLALWPVLWLLMACNHSPQNNKNSDASSKPTARIDTETIAQLFDQQQSNATFVLYELQADRWTIHQAARADSAVLPASTFKIANSLIALECEVLSDENESWPWDGIERPVSAWNQDHSLRSGIAVSAVWFYQEVTRRVGVERMQEWVRKLDYGNQNIDGGIDLFWLTGDLRISARQQIGFLKRLYHEELPVKVKNMAIVKDILIQSQNEQYVLRGKTGWANVTEPNLGWYVGWLEEGEEVYFFALNLDIYQGSDAAKRRELVWAVFEEMGLMKEGSLEGKE